MITYKVRKSTNSKTHPLYKNEEKILQIVGKLYKRVLNTETKVMSNLHLISQYATSNSIGLIRTLAIRRSSFILT